MGKPKERIEVKVIVRRIDQNRATIELTVGTKIKRLIEDMGIGDVYALNLENPIINKILKEDLFKREDVK